MERVFNFAPGPSMLPLPVLEQIQKELLCYGSTGMSVMEMSHRSSMYLDIFNQTVADLREVMAIPDHYKVLFPQGGATAMFAAVAMNLMDGGHADYVDSGNFAHNALVEAQKYGAVNVAGSSRAENYTHIPDYTLSPDANTSTSRPTTRFTARAGITFPTRATCRWSRICPPTSSARSTTCANSA